MALKDWKKINRLVSNLDTRYINYNKYLTLDIHDKLSVLSPQYRVSVTLTKNMQLHPILDKFFKSKSATLKFAKSYMRKN